MAEERLTEARTTGAEAIVTYHDPCYLGRGNGIYDIPRSVLKKLTHHLVEMKRHKSFALCCGAGGGQMFKKAEKEIRKFTWNVPKRHWAQERM